MRDKIRQLLIELRLKGMQQVLDRELAAAEKKGQAPGEVLYRLLCEELAYRQQRNIDYRLKHAKIPFDWTLKTSPFDKQPGVKKSQVMSLTYNLANRCALHGLIYLRVDGSAFVSSGVVSPLIFISAYF